MTSVVDNINLGNVDEGEILPIIHDDFDQYEGPVWDDGCENLDDYLQRLYNNGEFYVDEGFGNIKLKPWLLFTDKQHVRDVIRDYAIQCGFSVVVETTTNFRYTIRCSEERCGWKLHASKLVDGVKWAIKYIENPEHSCLGVEVKNPMVSAKWAPKALLEDIRANNDIPGDALNELLWNRYKVEMSKSTLYRMRAMALAEIHGPHDVSYSYLPSYCQVVKSTNPDSIAQTSWYPEDHPERPLFFASIFISFKGCIDGLMGGCRGLIGVDGTFLKGEYGGVLLTAVALDGNNDMFPFAWGIVSGEDDETWKFFMHHLKNILFEGRGNNWCIISDRHKSIDNACSTIWPEVGRRYCIRHLSVNWKADFPGPRMWQLFWLACGAYSDFTFKKAMQQLDVEKKGGRVWLNDVGPKNRWSKHKFDPNIKCDVNKTNFVESFNAILGVDRCRPVLTLLEGIRRSCMVRMAARQELCESWARQDVCPNVIKRVQKLCQDSRLCRVYPSGQGEYEIKEGYSTLAVSLNDHTCKCNEWQLTGIPCKHGMRAILFVGLDPLKLVHEWYSVDTYKLAYKHGIKSVPDREQWPDNTMHPIQPPVMKRGVGRPKKQRKRGEEEQRKGKRSATIRCGRCGEFGHNRLTCQGGLTKKQKEASAKGKAGKKSAPKDKGKQPACTKKKEKSYL